MLIMMARVMKYGINGLQGNKGKTPPTSKNHFKRIISLLYILYCTNFVNWTKSIAIAVKAISKLDPFNVTQFINGHFREHYHDLLHSFNGNIYNGKQNVLSNSGNDDTVLLTSERKRTKILTKTSSHSKINNNSQSSSFSSYLQTHSKNMEIKSFNFPVKLQCKLYSIAKNKFKHLIKWKIRKKLSNCVTNTNRIKRSVNKSSMLSNNSTLITTNYSTVPIITTKKSIQTQFRPTKISEVTTQLTPNAITPINSITQIDSSNCSIICQQSLHRSRETNVFEMATKLKYNKLAKSKAIPLWNSNGQSELAAAEMAVRHINSKKILNEYTIELLTNDTKN